MKLLLFAIVLLLFAVVLAMESSGMGGFVFLIGLAGLIVGIVGLVRPEPQAKTL
ncbi:MAG TPA: hypothetical protein VFB69_04605 [Candidatus Dormibacteraeota bacterium]|nr:hypothetical protein [Candidatus Dormibacteraeota bacterium]